MAAAPSRAGKRHLPFFLPPPRPSSQQSASLGMPGAAGDRCSHQPSWQGSLSPRQQSNPPRCQLWEGAQGCCTEARVPCSSSPSPSGDLLTQHRLNPKDLRGWAVSEPGLVLVEAGTPSPSPALACQAALGVRVLPTGIHCPIGQGVGPNQTSTVDGGCAPAPPKGKAS